MLVSNLEDLWGATQGSSVLNMNVKLTTRADDLVCVALVWEVDGREASCEIRVCKKNPWTLEMICTSAELQLCNFGTTLSQPWYNFETTMRQLWYNLDTTLIQLWYNFETTLWQLRDNLETALILYWDNLKFIAIPEFSRRISEQWWWYIQLRTLAEAHFYTLHFTIYNPQLWQLSVEDL